MLLPIQRSNAISVMAIPNTIAMYAMAACRDKAGRSCSMSTAFPPGTNVAPDPIKKPPARFRIHISVSKLNARYRFLITDTTASHNRATNNQTAPPLLADRISGRSTKASTSRLEYAQHE